ncbi:MAG: hypothetical protein HC831_25710 [Chloroflexia bacterium]|nr:hypothetical protein [Chloroflexia bacterium]
MLKNYKRAIIVILIGISPILSKAQNNSSSPFSMFGVGDLANEGFGRNVAMGGVASPLISAYQLNPTNPSTYVGLVPNTFVFEFGLSSNYYILKTPAEENTKFDGSINYIAAGFPITKWWKSGIGLRPMSNIGYDITITEDLNFEDNSVVHNYTGEGGINSFYLDNSFSIAKPISVGVKLAYVFGTLDRTRTITTTVTENSLSSSTTVENNKAVFDAVSVGFGAHFHKLINENLFINIGATYDLKTNLDGNQDRFSYITISNINGNYRDTLENKTVHRGALILPQSYGIGASVLLKQKLELAVDYKLDKWSESKSFEQNLGLSDNQRFSAGIEYIPDYSSTKYFKLIRYRAGFNYTNSYLTYNEKQLKQIGGSLGFAFPLRSGAFINISATYNKRSIPGEDILTEDQFQFHFNLSMKASWFVKRKFY